MATTGEPMSDARLADIRQRVAEIDVLAEQYVQTVFPDLGDDYVRDVTDLLAEVERRGERYDALLSLSTAALDNSKRREAEMHAALMRILDDADTFDWVSDAVSAARRRFPRCGRIATGRTSPAPGMEESDVD